VRHAECPKIKRKFGTAGWALTLGNSPDDSWILLRDLKFLKYSTHRAIWYN
jgi:hypothetical protein